MDRYDGNLAGKRRYRSWPVGEIADRQLCSAPSDRSLPGSARAEPVRYYEGRK